MRSGLWHGEKAYANWDEQGLGWVWGCCFLSFPSYKSSQWEEGLLKRGPMEEVLFPISLRSIFKEFGNIRFSEKYKYSKKIKSKLLKVTQ